MSKDSVLDLACSLLQLRGQHATSTPHADDHGNILLFNGAPNVSEINYECLMQSSIILQISGHQFGQAAKNVCGVCLGEIFGGLHIPEGCNDGHTLMQALGQRGTDVSDLLSQLRGPWALMYWQASSRTLWFGRDAIGDPSFSVYAARLDVWGSHLSR